MVAARPMFRGWDSCAGSGLLARTAACRERLAGVSRAVGLQHPDCAVPRIPGHQRAVARGILVARSRAARRGRAFADLGVAQTATVQTGRRRLEFGELIRLPAFTLLAILAPVVRSLLGTLALPGVLMALQAPTSAGTSRATVDVPMVNSNAPKPRIDRSVAEDQVLRRSCSSPVERGTEQRSVKANAADLVSRQTVVEVAPHPNEGAPLEGVRDACRSLPGMVGVARATVQVEWH